MSFIIWKASITEYRIQNQDTKEVQVLENFTAVNCKLRVNLKQYYDAKKLGFANSGNPFDFFAWIEAEAIRPAEVDLTAKVFYNPFKSPFFRDRESGKVKQKAIKIVINQNTLSYE